MTEEDKTALSYWFPKIAAASLPVPRTVIIEMPPEVRKTVFAWLEGRDDSSGEVTEKFFAELTAAARSMGFPCFLRTDHTSGKHEWERTCFVQRPEVIAEHVCRIAEYSECVDIIGLPWSTWAVREFLPTTPLGYCPRYENMPVCREFRCFVDDGTVHCAHPYWPLEALRQGGCMNIDYEAWGTMPECVHRLASAAGKAVGGYWSIDILDTKRGWFITDMAEGEKSFHWEGCRNERGARAPAAV